MDADTHAHEPASDAIDEIVEAFDRAPRPAVADVVIGNRIRAGLDHVCDTEAEGDDEQRRSTGFSEPDPLEGSDDWAALTYRAVMADGAGGADHVAHPDVEPLTFEENQQVDEAENEALSPDVAVTKSADRDEALPGDTIEYAIEVTNVGSGEGIDVELVDTLPDGSIETVALPTWLRRLHDRDHHVRGAGRLHGRGRAGERGTVSASNLLGSPEENTSNNTDDATVVVLTPVMELDKSADATVAPGGSSPPR